MSKLILALTLLLAAGCASSVKQEINRTVASKDYTLIPMNKISSVDVKFAYKIQPTTEVINGIRPFIKQSKLIYLNLSSNNCSSTMTGPDKWIKTPVMDAIDSLPMQLTDAKLTAFKSAGEYDKVHVDGQPDFMNNFIEIKKDLGNGVTFTFFCRNFFDEYKSYSNFLREYYGENIYDLNVETFNKMMERFFQIKLN